MTRRNIRCFTGVSAMTAIGLTDRNFTPMSGEADTTIWETAATIGFTMLGAIAGFVFKSGGLQAKVTALADRVDALETGNNKIDDRLEKTATKEDMRDGFNDIKSQVRDAETKQQVRDAEIKQQVSDLMKAVYDNRLSYRPPANPIG